MQSFETDSQIVKFFSQIEKSDEFNLHTSKLPHPDKVTVTEALPSKPTITDETKTITAEGNNSKVIIYITLQEKHPHEFSIEAVEQPKQGNPIDLGKVTKIEA